MIVSIGIFPKATYLSSKMIDDKTKQASLNIEASEFGQKFGEWNIYIEKDENNVYYDIKLFKNCVVKNIMILCPVNCTKCHHFQ